MAQNWTLVSLSARARKNSSASLIDASKRHSLALLLSVQQTTEINAPTEVEATPTNRRMPASLSCHHRQRQFDRGLRHREARPCNRCFGQNLGSPDPKAR